MKLKDFISDVWLAFGLIGFAVGLVIPVIGVFYVLWGLLK